MAKMKRYRRPRPHLGVPAEALPAQAVNVEVVDARVRAWLPRFAFVSAFLAAVGALYAGYGWLGLPKVVVESTLQEAVDKLRHEVREDISKITRKQDQGTVTVLEMQVRQLFMQKTQIQSSLSSIESQLRERPGDTFLLERKSQLQIFDRNVDKESDALQDQLRKTRQ